MKKIILPLVAMAFLTACGEEKTNVDTTTDSNAPGSAVEENNVGSVKLGNELDSVSYCIGMSFAENLGNGGLENPNLKAVMVSGNADDPEIKAMCRDEKITLFDKPLMLKVLLEEIKKMVGA